MRKDMKRRIAWDKRGKITTGNRGKDKKEYPKALPFFNLVNFPELQAIYGDKPTKILVMFPTNNIKDFYNTEYTQWGSSRDLAVKKRACDGEVCTHPVEGTEQPCYCRELPGKEQCQAYMGLKAYVLDEQGNIVNFTPYMFESHSVNSADSIYFDIERVFKGLGKRLEGVPFMLSVQMVQKLDEKGKKKKFPIWSIQPYGTVTQLKSLAEHAALPIEAAEVKAIEGPEIDNTEYQEIIKRLQEKKTRMDKLALIGDMILDMTQGDAEAAKNALFEYSSFEDEKTGEKVPGVNNRQALDKLSERWINTIYGQVKAKYLELASVVDSVPINN